MGTEARTLFLKGPLAPEASRNNMESEFVADDEMMSLDFDGVFRFTNNSDEDFIALWNNKEYLFPAHKTVKLVMADETLENIQEIRKRFAYRWAVREFYKGKEYLKMSKMGNGLPPTFDERILEPMIQECLTPLPEESLKVKTKPKDSDKNYTSKGITDKENPNFVFREESESVQAIGKMPTKLI